MRKKNLLLTASLASVLLLAACGNDDGKYEKLMNKADKAMENLEVDKAIEYYEEILALDPMNYKYGVSRSIIVEDLLSNATGLQDRLQYLQDTVDYVKEASEDVEFKVENAAQISEVYASIQSALYELEDYPSTKMYKDVAEVEKEFAKNTQDKIIAPLLEEIDKNMEALKFDVAEQQVDALSALAEYNVGDISVEKIEEYYEKISTQKERYVVMPRSYVKREQVLFDGGDAGKITFLGEATSQDYEELKVFFKVEGTLVHTVSELSLKSRYILSDGTADETEDFSVTDYGSYKILEQTISLNEDVSVVRYDYNMNILQLEDYKSITLKETDGEGELPALLKVEDDKTIAIDLKIEDADKAINFTNMIVDSSYVTLQGTVTAKKDLEIDETAYFTVPGYEVSSDEDYDDSLYAGVAKDIELTFSLENYLTSEMPYGHFLLFGKTYNLDLKTGKEVAKVTSQIVDIISYSSVEDDFSYDEGLNADKLFTDVAGKVYGNVVAVTNGYFYSKGDPKWYYQLNQKYATFKVDVGLEKERASENFGSSKVTFKGDGNVLKTINLGANAATTTVELNVSNVEQLIVEVEMTEGNEGYQEVLLGNGVMTAK